jgi:predicted Zn-dependent protease
VNPVTGKKDFLIMSEEQEKAIGQQSDPQIVASYGLYENEELKEIVDSIGNEIVKICHRPNLGYTFRMLNSPVVNAFAVPGGYVYLTRGILAHFNSEAELAGVFGHEIGHITAKHSARQQTTQLLTQVGLVTGSILSEEVASIADVLSQGAGLLMLSYSRAHESESDELGVLYSMRVGYDAHQMADFFLTLKKLSTPAEGEPLPEFYSTHPDPGNRHERVHQLADEYARGYPGKTFKIKRNQYLRRINGIIYGPDPRDGFVRDNKFYVPKANLQLESPTGWQYQINAERTQWLSPQEDAFLMFGLDRVESPQKGLNEFVESAGLNILDQKNVLVNDWPGIEFLANTQPQNANSQPLTVGGVLFEKNDQVFYHIGISYASAWNKYEPEFRKGRNSISDIKSSEIRNIKPERIKIISIDSEASLREVLDQLNADKDRYQEIALLNNFDLDDPIEPGTLIKTIGK